MRCYWHEEEAIGVCVNCGRPVCSDCAVDVQGTVYCKQCAGAKFASIKGPKRMSFLSRTIIPPVQLPFSSKQMISMLGSALLIAGVFAPIVGAPFGGSVSYMGTGRRDGIIVLILSLISLGISAFQHYKWLWATGLASLGFIIADFVHVRQELQLFTETEESIFSGLMHLSWGWAILALGTILILLAALADTLGLTQND